MLWRDTRRTRLCSNATIDLTPLKKFCAMSSAFGRASSSNQTRPMGRLLHRQVKMLEYLTSGDAIFGGNGPAPTDPALSGINREMLHLEARFSHEKRMEKIADVFPATFSLLGSGLAGVVRDFVRTCPPLDISRIENARQFHDFLTARWGRKPPSKLYLPD